jgi:MFS family permease
MIATGLVGIGLDFHKGPGTTASLISVLYLCSAVMQPTMGKLATIFGARRIFLTGVTILLIAGITGAAAPAFGFLLLAHDDPRQKDPRPHRHVTTPSSAGGPAWTS